MDQEADIDPRFELKIDPGRPLPEAIADTLRGLVEDGEYTPGSKLPNESELARQLKVARSSVRTALQRLEAQGVLQVRRGLGWYVQRKPPGGGVDYVSNVGEYEISDLFELRIGLEGLAVSLAAVRATAAEIENIWQLNLLHREAVDPASRLSTDLAFHDAIFEAGKNKPLIETYYRIIGRLNDWRLQSLATPGPHRSSCRDHARIVGHLRNRDSGGAKVAMDAHLQRLYEQLPKIEHEPLGGPENVVVPETRWFSREGVH